MRSISYTLIFLCVQVACSPSATRPNNNRTQEAAFQRPVSSPAEITELVAEARRKSAGKTAVSTGDMLSEILSDRAIAHQIIVFFDVPEHGWYPLIEIIGKDKDQLCNPFEGQMANAAYPEALISDADFSKFSDYPRMNWGGSVAVYETTVAAAGFHFQLVDDAMAVRGCISHCYKPAYSYAGPAEKPIGRHNLMHSFFLESLEAGETAELNLKLSSGEFNDLLFVAEGASLLTKTDGIQNGVSLLFQADMTGPTIRLGARKPIQFQELEWVLP